MVKKTNVKKLQQGGFGDITQLLNSIQLGVTNNSGIYKDPAPYEQLSFKDYQTKFNYTYKIDNSSKNPFISDKGYFFDKDGNKISKGDFTAMYNQYIKDEQDKYNTNLTQYKEQQPFAANLAGLMQVQQMEQDELLNKKTKLSDFPTQYSSYAPVGFAKDGGGMYVDGMNKRDKSLISNNFMQQLMGYKDSSPFKNLPFQDIMSNNITMDGVSKPLLLMPNNDTARLAPPNSGNYFFPNSTSVRELPLNNMQQGGALRDLIAKFGYDLHWNGLPQEWQYQEPLLQKQTTPQEQVDERSPFRLQGDNTWEYKETANGWETRRIGNTKWIPINGMRNKNNVAKANRILETEKRKIAGVTPAVVPPSTVSLLLTQAQQAAQTQQAAQIVPQTQVQTQTQEQTVPQAQTEVASFRLDGDKTWEYRETANGYETRRIGTSKWLPIKSSKILEDRKKNLSNGGSLLLFANGGKVQLPVGNFDNKHKQYTTFENLIPVQTEMNELIVLPNLSLAKVNAKKRHSQMKTDEVTDVAPNGSYVLSHYGDTKIYKEEASRVDMELHDKPYNTAKSNSIPVIKTLGDLMKSKRMSPADLARVVDKKFTTAEDNGDPYIMQTNSVNKSRKDNYITKIVQLSEMDKERKGLNEVEKFYHGGAPVQKAPAGTLLMALLPSLIAAAPQVAGMISNNNSQKDVKRNTAQSIRDINNTYEGVLGLENNALAANLLGISLQNPNIKPVIQDDSFIAGIPNLLNATYNNVYEGQKNSLMANRPDFSAFSPQVATLLSDRSNAQSMGALSNLSLGLAKERAAATSKSAYDRMGIFNANSASRTGAENATQANVNANLAAAAGAVSGSYSNRQNMLYNKTNSIMGARGQQAQQLMQLQNQQAQNLVGLGATGLQAYNSFQAANRQQQVEDRMAYQDQFGYNTPPLGQTPLGPINSGSPCVLVLGKMINRITGQPC